jgi:protein-S-isoprenylcysteine O-methyltransferase Ste14
MDDRRLCRAVVTFFDLSLPVLWRETTSGNNLAAFQHRIPCHLEFGWCVRTIGCGLFVASLSVYVRTAYFLATRGRGAYVEFDPPRRFVGSGPYRWVRNPIAASAVIMFFAEALAFSSTGILALVPVVCLLAHLQVVFLEEPLLGKRFGRDYADYLNRVPRWIPRHPGRDTP